MAFRKETFGTLENGAVITTGFEIEFVATATANVYTVNVKVDSKVVASTTVTITPDVTPGGKTGIKGTVKRLQGSNYSNAPYAFVLVTKQGSNVVVSATATDANGEFAFEGLEAGSYRVITRWALVAPSAVTNYANTVINDVVVTDGAMTTVASKDADYIAINRRLSGDANDDGVVNSTDLNAVKNALAK